MVEEEEEKKAAETSLTKAVVEAVVAGHAGTLRKLYDSGESSDAESNEGFTALMFAAASSKHDIINLLIEKYHVGLDKQSSEGFTALMFAADAGDDYAVEQLLLKGASVNLGDIKKETALTLAVRAGQAETVKVLCKAGADPSILNRDGETALTLAAREGHTEVVHVLCEEGADPNIQDETETTALMYAVRAGHTETVKVLFAAGAKPNIQDKLRKTALMYAVHEGHAETVKVLCEAGANPDIQDERGNTALMYAVEAGHAEVVHELLIKKEKITVDRAKRKLELITVRKGAKPNLQNLEGDSALTLASALGHAEVVHELCAAGVGERIDCTAQGTILLKAVRTGNAEVVHELCAAGVGGRIKRTAQGFILLDAVRAGHAEVVHELCAAGVGERYQIDALKIAAREGRAEVAHVLLQRTNPRLCQEIRRVANLSEEREERRGGGGDGEIDKERDEERFLEERYKQLSQQGIKNPKTLVSDLVEREKEKRKNETALRQAADECFFDRTPPPDLRNRQQLKDHRDRELERLKFLKELRRYQELEFKLASETRALLKKRKEEAKVKDEAEKERSKNGSYYSEIETMREAGRVLYLKKEAAEKELETQRELLVNSIREIWGDDKKRQDPEKESKEDKTCRLLEEVEGVKKNRNNQVKPEDVIAFLLKRAREKRLLHSFVVTAEGTEVHQEYRNTEEVLATSGSQATSHDSFGEEVNNREMFLTPEGMPCSRVDKANDSPTLRVPRRSIVRQRNVDGTTQDSFRVAHYDKQRRITKLKESFRKIEETKRVHSDTLEFFEPEVVVTTALGRPDDKQHSLRTITADVSGLVGCNKKRKREGISLNYAIIGLTSFELNDNSTVHRPRLEVIAVMDDKCNLCGFRVKEPHEEQYRKIRTAEQKQVEEELCRVLLTERGSLVPSITLMGIDQGKKPVLQVMDRERVGELLKRSSVRQYPATMRSGFTATHLSAAAAAPAAAIGGMGRR